MDEQPPAKEVAFIPVGGLALDDYRRLAYGLRCPGCHKRLHSKVLAKLDAHGMPVAGREKRYHLSVLCNRPTCRMRVSLDKLVTFITAPQDRAVSATGDLSAHR